MARAGCRHTTVGRPGEGAAAPRRWCRPMGPTTGDVSVCPNTGRGQWVVPRPLLPPSSSTASHGPADGPAPVRALRGRARHLRESYLRECENGRALRGGRRREETRCEESGSAHPAPGSRPARPPPSPRPVASRPPQGRLWSQTGPRTCTPSGGWRGAPREGAGAERRGQRGAPRRPATWSPSHRARLCTARPHSDTGPGARSGLSALLLCPRAAAGPGQGHGRLLHHPARPSTWAEATSEATRSHVAWFAMPLGWAAGPAPLWVGGQL